MQSVNNGNPGTKASWLGKSRALKPKDIWAIWIQLQKRL